MRRKKSCECEKRINTREHNGERKNTHTEWIRDSFPFSKIQSHGALINSKFIKYKLNGVLLIRRHSAVEWKEMWELNIHRILSVSVFFFHLSNIVSHMIAFHSFLTENEIIEQLDAVVHWTWEIELQLGWHRYCGGCNIQMTMIHSHNDGQIVTEDVIVWVWPS